MSQATKTVNLDAMIPRADFAVKDDHAAPGENQEKIGLRDLVDDSLLLPNLRKPDFQRETNHWAAEQVVDLIKSFMDGDLIPAVILWRSESYVFVIDGGHRLSALRAWILDDYGDGAVSRQFFGDEITSAQKQAAKNTRMLIAETLGTYQHWRTLNAQTPKTHLQPEERSRLQRFSSGAVSIQWVPGNAEKAESSFFKINTQGTPLDETEELLISNRKRPIAIAARSIIRAGMGHKYWSAFAPEKQQAIEAKAKQLNELLFEPELKTPIKTLDLPLGGTAGVRTALTLLIDLVLIANRDQQGQPVAIKDQPEDSDGTATIGTLDKTLALVQRMTGNARGSLGLHPAVYFYSAAGRFAAPLFMGVATQIARALANNDPKFFYRYTKARAQYEALLLSKRHLLATISQQVSSRKRYATLGNLFDFLLTEVAAGNEPADDAIVSQSGLKATVLVPRASAVAARFSDDTKSAVFLKSALQSALKCTLCNGFLDPAKAVSYDHVQRVREGGMADESNCQLVHPWCNQAEKN